ncbi:Zinc finger BED domain-containing protein RICESLEEPER 1 [Euphorbia peplus]|nr:Zinc finger BED domain-containing protein RICESLEEPER 1 [Euphorbia peplus]
MSLIDGRSFCRIMDSMDITRVTAEDNEETPIISVEQPNKRRRKKSIVWEHFTIETLGAGCTRAYCKQCKKSFAYITGSKLAGTSHLKRHITLGICPVSRQKNEASQLVSGVKSDPPKRRYRTSPALGSINFDLDRCNRDVAKMIIQHDYPLHMVEHPAFVDFVCTLQPRYNMASFDTIQGECVALYLREKQGLMDLIGGIPGRVSISLDLRTSNRNVGYAFLTGHFIDNDWNLRRCLLKVVMLPFPESEYAFNQAVISCISDWHLESRLFTVTLDKSVSNDNIIGHLRGVLSVKNQLMFNGQLVKGNCYARVLSRLAQDALGATGEVVWRIRESVKYVKTSDTHDERFAELRQRLQVPSTRELIIDDQTKWDTTYHMLVAACELKEVFSCLDTSDPVYRINPSMDDWKQGEILCTFLKLFYDAASILTGPMYPPSNAFYHEVSKIQLELTHAAMSQDPFVSNLAGPLKEKFDQYWRDCFLVLAIAMVMDPRFKMKLVEFSFSKIFSEDAYTWIKIVDDGIHELFLDYLPPHLSVPTIYMEAGNTSISEAEIFQEAPHYEVVAPETSFQAHELPLQVGEEVAKQMDSQEAAMQDKNGRVETTQEKNGQVAATQETNGEEVRAKEMDNQEAAAHQMVIEDVRMQEMQHSAEFQVQEKHVEEGPFEENITKKVSTEEVLQAEGMTEKMQDQENTSHEMKARDEPIEENTTSDIHVEKISNAEMHSQEQAHQMQLGEARNREMQPQESQSQDVHFQEVRYYDQHHRHHHEAIHNEEMHSQRIQAQETDYQAMSHEMHAQDNLPLLSIGDGFQDFEVYISDMTNSQHLKSELDQYLEESLLTRVQDFDVLGWWKLNKLKYPTLSKMAADILSIPVSTVAPESVFDVRSKKIDSYQSSLRPVTLEALICAKDWLRYGLSASSLDG